MLRDHCVPDGFLRDTSGVRSFGEAQVGKVDWEPHCLAPLARHLGSRGEEALRGVSRREILAAWDGAIAELRDRRSARRQALEPALASLCRLSPAGLAAGLDVVLAGADGEAAAALAARLQPAPERGLALVVLASNVPGLAVQPLLRLLLEQRPLLLKSSSAEPLFAPALVEALVERLPALADAVAAMTWPGSDQQLNAEACRAAGEVIAYGGDAAIAELHSLTQKPFLALGPKASVAVVGGDAEIVATAHAIARDIALFDQRGCLSVQAVYTSGDAAGLANALAAALRERAHEWPAGPILPEEAAAVQQARAEADLRACFRPDLELAQGTVILDPDPRFRPGPGLRTVRIHPLPDLSDLPALLEPWAGRLQGIAEAGTIPAGLRARLGELGVTRFAPAGELQHADATWENWGEALGAAAGPTSASAG
ncbi:MAG: acyl-CoA reductase [Acidobacteriota bacterium]